MRSRWAHLSMLYLQSLKQRAECLPDPVLGIVCVDTWEHRECIPIPCLDKQIVHQSAYTEGSKWQGTNIKGWRLQI